jgi:type IV pilus assembly protein PilC
MIDLPLTLLIGLLGFAVSWFCCWSVASAVESLAWSLSGEAGAMFVRGFGSHGWRMRKTAGLRRIIEHIRVATALNLPLPHALRLAGNGEPGPTGLQLTEIANHIDAGMPLSEAIDQAVAGCPPLLVQMIQRGERCGQTAGAIETASRMLGERLIDTPHRASHSFAYLLVVSATTITILSGIMIIVVPKFKDIFLDFDVTLPPATQWLIDTWHPTTFVLFAVIAFVVVPCALAAASAAGSPLAWVVGRLRWLFPVTRRIDFGFGMASAVRAIALAVRSGLPLDRAIDAADTVGLGNPLAPRLRSFMQKVRSGTRPHLAARESRLGSVFVAGLSTIERGEAPEPVLDYAAEYYQSIGYRWWILLASVSTPAVTLFLAGIVGFVVYAMFIPLVTLIQSVSETIG